MVTLKQIELTIQDRTDAGMAGGTGPAEARAAAPGLSKRPAEGTLLGALALVP